MKWVKKGLIFAPTGEFWWAKSHAHLPTSIALDSKIIRVFFASLDKDKFGRIGYVDVDAGDPKIVLKVASKPVLDIGELGTFDDCGVVPSCFVKSNNGYYLYYIGFQRSEKVPYMLFTGLAFGDPVTAKFKKYSQVPILDRINGEPFSRAAPYILISNGFYQMWYWTCLGWVSSAQGVHYKNVIKYATSRDGVSWNSHEEICIQPDFQTEYAVGRPCVVFENGVYLMWYSIRSFDKLYTIGYAESTDGIHWERKDSEAGIEKSGSGWDSQMICYPNVIKVPSGNTYMFYNGNRHGESGFGYAVLEG